LQPRGENGQLPSEIFKKTFEDPKTFFLLGKTTVFNHFALSLQKYQLVAAMVTIHCVMTEATTLVNKFAQDSINKTIKKIRHA